MIINKKRIENETKFKHIQNETIKTCRKSHKIYQNFD